MITQQAALFTENLTNIKDIKTYLHTQVYTNPESIDLLRKFINETNMFNAEEFIESERLISVRIKKTQVKKNNAYCHDSSFYYTILSNAIAQYFMSIGLPPGQYWNMLINIITLNDNYLQIRL